MPTTPEQVAALFSETDRKWADLAALSVEDSRWAELAGRGLLVDPSVAKTGWRWGTRRSSNAADEVEQHSFMVPGMDIRHAIRAVDAELWPSSVRGYLTRRIARHVFRVAPLGTAGPIAGTATISLESRPEGTLLTIAAPKRWRLGLDGFASSNPLVPNRAMNAKTYREEHLTPLWPSRMAFYLTTPHRGAALEL